MDITVRQTTLDDLDALTAIVTDPRVAVHQLRRADRDAREQLQRQLEGRATNDWGTTHNFTIVLADGRVIGDVIATRCGEPDLPHCYCGWDLHPDFWGKGFMPRALTMLFDDWFTSKWVLQIVSDCFRTNRRCVRVMEKVGYVRIVIPLTHRVQMAWSHRTKHWIVRYCLNRPMWKQRRPHLFADEAEPPEQTPETPSSLPEFLAS